MARYMAKSQRSKVPPPKMSFQTNLIAELDSNAIKCESERQQPHRKNPMILNVRTVQAQAQYLNNVQVQHEQLQKLQQHQQQQQQQYHHQSRIPTMTHNFNQISKTATNLLHDIYEKHLLNQTKFDCTNDDVSTAKYIAARKNSTSGAIAIERSETDFKFNNHNLYRNEMQTALLTPAKGNHLNVTFQHQSTDQSMTTMHFEKITANKNARVRFVNRNAAIISNEVIVNGKGKIGCDSDSVTDVQIKKLHENSNKTIGDNFCLPPSIQQQQQQQLLLMQQQKQYELSKKYAPSRNSSYADGGEMSFMHVQPNIVEKNHFYESPIYNGYGNKQHINSKISLDDCHFYRSNYANASKSFTKIVGDSVAASYLERGQPVGGNFCEDTSTKQKTPTTLLTTTPAAAGAAIPSPLAVISAVNAKACSNTFTTNAITTSGGVSTLATNCEYTSNSKINIMFETAQAMAAAGYFARLVVTQ